MTNEKNPSIFKYISMPFQVLYWKMAEISNSPV